MKMLKKISLVTTIAAILMSSNAMADSWTVTQSTDLTGATGPTLMQQTGTAATSRQALNNIHLDSTDGTIAATSLQEVKLNGQTLTLDQDGAGASNVQAANNAEAAIVDDLTQSVTATAATTINLEQGVTSATGDSNRQAINRVKSNDINATASGDLQQEIIDSDISLDLKQAGAGKGNIQAGNLIETDGNIAAGTKQTVDVKAITMNQASVSKGIQAGNAIAIGTGAVTTGGTTSQTFTTDTLSMVQTGTTDAIQAGNYIGLTLTP